MSEQSEVQNIRDVNAYLKSIVESRTLQESLWVGGIVKAVFESDRGHIYFNLVDDDVSIYCMLPERIRGTLDFTLSNGMEVELYGTARVWEKQARLQIQIEQARLIRRPLFVITATIQEQLAKRGLFPKTKKSLPKEVKRITVITSKQSEALHDFEHTYREEAKNAATVKVIDVRIEGQQAPREISDAINRVNNNQDTDVIVLVRGGGRRMDLAAFNDFLIAEAICRSNIPVITGIGHQRDETFADQVADYCAITPTAAASYLAKASSAQETPQPEQQVALRNPQKQQKYVVILILIIIVLAAVIFILLQNLSTS